MLKMLLDWCFLGISQSKNGVPMSCEGSVFGIEMKELSDCFKLNLDKS